MEDEELSSDSEGDMPELDDGGCVLLIWGAQGAAATGAVCIALCYRFAGSLSRPPGSTTRDPAFALSLSAPARG